MIARLLLVAAASGIVFPACAADRNYSVTEFDQVDVSGPYRVIVETGRAPSARASGDQASLDRVIVEVRSRRLVVSASKTAWGERAFLKQGPVIVRVSTLGLKRVQLTGSGSLEIDRIRAPRLFVSQAGSGAIKIAEIDAEQLDLVTQGSGLVVIGGRNLTGRISNNGSGRIDGLELVVTNVDVRSNSAGETSVTAQRSAKVVATSAGGVTIGGSPACTVTHLGAGEVQCGAASRQ